MLLYSIRSTHSLGSTQVTTGFPGIRGYELYDYPALVGTNGRPYYGLSRIFQVSPNNAPVFTGGPLSRSIPENTTTVTDIGAAIHVATDADNDPLTYTMEGADADSFAFDAATRQIKTKAGVIYDHEADPSYEVTIKAADDNGGAATVAVTIAVTDEAEPPAAPAAPSVVATAGSSTSLNVGWARRATPAGRIFQATTCATGPAPGTGPTARRTWRRPSR